MRTRTCGEDPLGDACFHSATGEGFGGRQGRFERVRPQRQRPCLAVLKLWSPDLAELKKAPVIRGSPALQIACVDIEVIRWVNDDLLTQVVLATSIGSWWRGLTLLVESAGIGW